VQVRRVDRLIERLRELDLAAIVVNEPCNRFYLTGWPTHDSQPGETAYWLLVDLDSATIVSSSGNEAEARQEVPEARFVGLQRFESAATRLGELAKAAGYPRVGYDDTHLGAGDYLRLRAALPDKVELVGTGELIREMRAVKEPGELDLLRQAVAITDNALDAVREAIKPGTTEKALAWFVERHIRELGADGLGFDVLVGSGPGAAFAHHQPTERVIQPGEPCWIDVGAQVGGYSADLSRAFCLGTPDERTQYAYDALIAALDLNVAGLTVGADGQAVALRSAAELERRGLPVGHVGGHGIGLQVHELPNVDRARSVTLVENMVVTADPGTYTPGWGGMRVEDNVLVTANGPEVLSKASRRLDAP
jgi:Xaa-Pro aminopeptidase